MRTTRIRLPADIYDAAVTSAASASRTVTQQIAHWARIGRELERSPQVNHRAVAQVLDGDASYDLLGAPEQAVVRATWMERAAALREGLDFAAEFTEAGESYSEADEEGSVVVHPAPDASDRG